MCSETCTSEKKNFLNRETLDFSLSSVWILIFHKNVHPTTVAESESVSEPELFFGFGSSQNIRIISDSDPQHCILVVKTGALDLADFARTLVPLGFSLWHIHVPVSEVPMFANSFYADCHNFITLNFSGNVIARTWHIPASAWCVATITIPYAGVQIGLLTVIGIIIGCSLCSYALQPVINA
jgi:hypothetical protein